MQVGHSGSRFRTTSWTLIVSARESRADLETLLQRYWSPVYAYLRRRGRSPEDAADLTQAFLSEVVLSRDLIGQADPARGRFRSFLLTALKRFVIDEHRRQFGRSGERHGRFVPADTRILERAEPSHDDAPDHAFERQWAATVLSAAIERLRDQCTRDGLAAHWRAFEERVLNPTVSGCAAASVGAIGQELGACSAGDVSGMLHTVKRKFRSVLREVVAETVEYEAEVEAELRELRRWLGK